MSQIPRYSRYCPKYQKSVYPPKVLKWPPHSGKSREIRRPFLWNPLNLQRIARKSLNSPPLARNHAKFARFLLCSTNPCSPTVPQLFLQQIPRNSLTSQILGAINAKLTYFALIPTNLLFYFSDSRKTGSSTLLARIMRIPQP